MLIFVKFAVEMVAVSVKTSWIGGNTDIFIPIYSADGLGFTVALWAKLELRIELIKKVSYPS